MKASYSQVEAQRDELLKAAKRAVELIRNAHFMAAWQNALKPAIARVEAEMKAVEEAS